MGVAGQCYMTLENTSNILATLMLDLREKEDEFEDFNCLQIEYVKRNNDDEQESEIMESVDEFWEHMEEQNQQPQTDEPLKKQNESLDQLSEDSSDQGESQEQQQHKSSRHYKIIAKPHNKYQFKLSFTPKDVKTYSFELPLTLLGIVNYLCQLE
eukprot:TRINITY_DN3532_c0_g1_i7.p2 TRINITY_DN3532_c0_g1~~TRINITY_DN3532_c0_g1_i7.p2  ORF type:complete len:155 (-),score=20.54 TRINITY_DN3532_c0_g1_i7:273-737(-)